VTATATVPPYLMACSHATYPEAGFTCNFPENPSSPIPDSPPYTVKCTDNSSSASDQPIDTWKWEFGDGGTSNARNPAHTYSLGGQYNIRLTVATWCGSKFSNTTVTGIDVYCSSPEPAFTTNVTEGFAPLAVQITDTSRNTPENITTWKYSLDNTPFGNDRNPVFFSATPGAYMISQEVRKNCVQAGSKPLPPAKLLIKVNPPLLSSNASHTNATSGTLPAPSSPAAAVSAVPVQSAPGALQNGTLSVITEPAGAQLFIDDVFTGTTPFMVGLPEGPHTVRLEKTGYHPMTVPVRVNGGKVTEFSTTLISAGSPGIAIVPVIALVVIILGIVAGGIYLFRKQKT
jgi:hypothetical protein